MKVVLLDTVSYLFDAIKLSERQLKWLFKI